MKNTISPNLVVDPEFNSVVESRGDNTQNETTWIFEAPRNELAPHHCIKGDLGNRHLVLEGNGDRQAFGCWKGQAHLEPGHWYRASVKIRWQGIENPHLSIFAQVAQRFLVPAGTDSSAGALAGAWPQELILERSFLHQAGPRVAAAEDATFELYLKATAQGRVEYSNPSIERIEPPKPRQARVATVRFGPTRELLNRETQRGRIAQKLALAGALQPDIVALPEFSPLCGLPDNYWPCLSDYAEAVPDGPTCQILAQAAKQHNMYVLAGIVERRGRHLFNTAVIFGRDGQFIGQYDKTHLTFAELQKGISCGESYPVFDLDFGRIAIHICYDEWFPEVARHFAHQGAEILFLPVAGGKPITWRTRALDNRLYFVASSITPASMIIDSSGAIIAETHGDGIAVADLDLDNRQTNVYGDPTLANAVPCLAPQMRHCLDDSLLEDLHHLMQPAH